MSEFALHSDFYEKLKKYIGYPIFKQGLLHPKNPYQRPLRTQDICEKDFIEPIGLSEIYSNKNLILNKILLTLYEQDFLFLDSSFQEDAGFEDFKKFYQPEFIALGKYIKPQLEYLAFSFLDKQIEVIGDWDANRLKEYCENIIIDQEKTGSALCEAIISSKHPELSLKSLLIQMAPDFLSEASAMARTLTGSFGEVQSELMKVFIDEYGYGVHKTKHSTLFEKTLSSLGLNQSIHYYYNDYLPTSLMLVNYFHYICSNKTNWFKYLGALYYTEASIPHFNKAVSEMIKSILPISNTQYFDEHVHIDKHHRTMVMEKMILPSIKLQGEKIIDDILVGFESFRLLQSLADTDLISQIQFHDGLKRSMDLENVEEIGKEVHFKESAEELTLSHIHGADEHFTVTYGELLFIAWGLEPIILKKGESILIPKGRLHSTVSLTEDTQYKVQAMKAKESA